MQETTYSAQLEEQSYSNAPYSLQQETSFSRLISQMGEQSKYMASGNTRVQNCFLSLSLSSHPTLFPEEKELIKRHDAK